MARGRASSATLGLACLLVLGGCLGYRTPLDDPSHDNKDAADANVGRDGIPGFDSRIACTPGKMELVRARPVVLFVLDRSATMGEGIVGGITVIPGDRSRWQVLTSVLAVVLPPVDDVMATGALFRYRRKI